MPSSSRALLVVKPITPSLSASADIDRLLGRELRAQLTCDGNQATIKIPNLFSDAEENDYRWYLQHFAPKQPFEASRAARVTRSLKRYGLTLSQQLLSSGVLPQHNDLTIRVEADSSTIGASSLQHLHWELLEDPFKWFGGYRPRDVVVTRTLPSLSTPSTSWESSSTCNILLVTCRPSGRYDIDPHLISGSIVKTINEAATQPSALRVRLKLLRPPTWLAFREHLLYDCQPGHYQLVHFDMHGEVLEADNLPSRAVLNFATLSARTPGKTRTDPRTGQEIAAVLKQAGAPGIVLNACESAKVSLATPNVNLAEILLREGAPFVVASSAVVMEHTAEIYMDAFYQNLLVERTSFAEAVHIARQRLLRYQNRRAHFRQTVSMEDFAVPVLYQNPNHRENALESIANSDGASSSPAFDIVDDDMAPIFGRGSDIQELELRIATGHLLLVYGQGGMGKTTFLKYCAWWWKATGFIDYTVYIHMSTREQVPLTLAELQEAIRMRVPEEENLIEGNGVMQILQQRRYLVVLDDIEAVKSLEPAERVSIERFLQSSAQGDSIIILAGRRRTCPLAEVVPSHSHYCLSGVSMQGALQLVESCSSWVAHQCAGQAAQDFLERSIILLERNPLAMSLVFTALGTENNTPEVVFRILLYGSTNIVYNSSNYSRYLNHLIALYMRLSLNGQYGNFSPTMLAPFWNFIPNDLSNYFWFCWAPFLIPGTDIESAANSAGYLDWVRPQWQQRVNEAVEVFGDGNFERLVQKLVDEDILDEIQITYASGITRQGYHINPVFTLFVRHMNAKTLRDAQLEDDIERVDQMLGLERLINTAFVSYQILGSNFTIPRMEKDPIKTLVWDNEIQHQDHCTNNFVAAFGRSFDLDMVADTDRHGMSTTDWVKSRSTHIFWDDRRTAELLKPLIRLQLLRLAIVATMRLRQREIAEMLDYVYLLTQAEEYEVSDVIAVSLRLFRKWQIRGREKLSPATELSWFQVRHAEAFIALRRQESSAKLLFERNLADDPITTASDSEYHLDTEIMRAQWQNLQGWIQCIRDESTTNPETIRGYGDFLKTIGPGEFHKFYLDMMKEGSPLYDAHKCLMQDMPLRDSMGLNGLLQQHEKVVAKFGNLAKSILEKPLFNTFAGHQEETMSEFTQQWTKEMASGSLASSLQDAMDIGEFNLRFLTSEDMASTMAALTKLLERETSFCNISYTKLDQLHDMMACVALKHEDWVVAIRHLDERWHLYRGATNSFTCEGGITRLCFAAVTMPGRAFAVHGFLEEAAPEVLRHLMEYGLFGGPDIAEEV
ncbi:MAG: hypothetical protein Q9168_002758 [Polycauliona sp. 1 TL-2023]